MGERLQVGIPWRPTASRKPAYAETVEWYQSNGFDVVVGDSGHEHFNAAATRNALVRVMEGPVRILSDADTTPELPALLESIEHVRRHGGVSLPYHLYRLTGDSGKFIPGATSGLFVLSPEGWRATRGQDERFEGWGYEDTAWALAYTTLVGPLHRARGVATARSHSQAPRDRVPSNRSVYRPYVDAYGDPAAMSLVVGALS